MDKDFLKRFSPENSSQKSLHGRSTGRPRIWYLVLPKFFFSFFSKVVPGTKMQLQHFSKIF
jgi:hypothetical protein